MKMMTKAKLATALLAGLVSTGAMAKAETYQIDPTHTSIVVSWNHFGFSNPTASFSGVTGQLVFDDADPDKSKVSVTIPVKTVDTRVPALTKEFLAGEYFDVANYPEATFVSTKVTPKGDDEYEVAGNLTIKGHTKPVVLDAHLNKRGEHPMAKKPAIGFDASTTIKRSDFGLDKYVPYVSDEIDIELTTEAVDK